MKVAIVVYHRKVVKKRKIRSKIKERKTKEVVEVIKEMINKINIGIKKAEVEAIRIKEIEEKKRKFLVKICQENIIGREAIMTITIQGIGTVEK